MSSLQSYTATDLFEYLCKKKDMLVLDVRNEEDFGWFNVEGPFPFEMANVPYFEFMEEEDQQRVSNIGNYKWKLEGEEIKLFDEKDVRNLQIPKGTLLPEEREIINDHIVITIDMLEKLPYPKKLRNVPEFAGGHHEKLDGTGYPKGLKDEEMSVQAKMMAIADIYEALTAADRPYKDGKKLSQAMRIMGFMKKDYEIDQDLFEIFVKEGVYKQYAEKYLGDDQLDEVDEAAVLA